jgi:hypothetical protein
MGGGRIFLKTLRASLFKNDLSNEPISAGSISLDSTFKMTKKVRVFDKQIWAVCKLGVVTIKMYTVVTFLKSLG